jgi:hypothetical protein
MRNRDTTLYFQMIPSDTLVTYKGEILWNRKKFLDYPIVGLKDDQIQQYCKWRSDAVNFMIFNPDRRCGNFDYWNRFDAVDPGKEYEVVYSLPAREEIVNAKLKKEKYHPDEFASDGIVPGADGNKWSDKTLKAFRCKAMYIKKG